MNYKIWADELIGFQGGQKDSQLWFCGLEYQDTDVEFYIEQFEKKQVNGHVLSTESENDVSMERFNKAILEIAKKLITKSRSLTDRNIFTSESLIYKINLYPPGLAKTDGNYPISIQNSLGIVNKADLQHKMRSGEFKRFDNIHKCASKNSRLIICCGRGVEDDFIHAFIGNKQKVDMYHKIRATKKCIQDDNKQNKYVTMRHYNVEGNDIVLAIVPFLSGYASSPSSREEKERLVKVIKDFLKNNDIKTIKL